MARTAPRWLLALGLIGCLSAQAASPVWAIRGAHNTVYLAGSIHLLRADDAALPAAFARAYAGSAQLVMEVDLAHLDASEMVGLMAEHARLPEGTSLEQQLGTERYRRVSASAAGFRDDDARPHSFGVWHLAGLARAQPPSRAVTAHCLRLVVDRRHPAVRIGDAGADDGVQR